MIKNEKKQQAIERRVHESLGLPTKNIRFKREVIKKPNYYKNYFRLTEEERALLETALDVTI